MYNFPGKKIDFYNEVIKYENKNKENMINIKNNSLLFPKNINNKMYNDTNNYMINQKDENLINNNINFINQRIKISNNNSIPINTTINSLDSSLKCTCSKTRCHKKYCICFSQKRFCEGCNCRNCENQPKILDQSIERINKLNVDINNPYNDNSQRVNCNCSKSNCMKKYCECFKQGINCNSLCRCISCNNSIKINNNKFNSIKSNVILEKINNNLTKSKDFPTYNINEKFGKTDYNNNQNIYQPEAFGIFIKKDKMVINSREILLNSINLISDNDNVIKGDKKNCINNFHKTPKFSNKKRARIKEENSCMKTSSITNSSNKKINGINNINKNIKLKELKLI